MRHRDKGKSGLVMQVYTCKGAKVPSISIEYCEVKGINSKQSQVLGSPGPRSSVPGSIVFTYPFHRRLQFFMQT